MHKSLQYHQWPMKLHSSSLHVNLRLSSFHSCVSHLGSIHLDFILEAVVRSQWWRVICPPDNNFLRAYSVSYSMVIIGIIKKNKTWPELSSLGVKQICQQMTQIRVIRTTVHVRTGLGRGINKRGSKKHPIYEHCHIYLCQSFSLKQWDQMRVPWCDIRVPTYFLGGYKVQIYKLEGGWDIGPIASNLSVMLCKAGSIS